MSGTQYSTASVADDDAYIPTTQVLLDECPRFRILVVGKSGVGKSSLINQAFKLENDIALVSHNDPGQADINKEFISPSNPRFVLHDSQGLELGEEENLDKVMNFIKGRTEKIFSTSRNAMGNETMDLDAKHSTRNSRSSKLKFWKKSRNSQLDTCAQPPGSQQSSAVSLLRSPEHQHADNLPLLLKDRLHAIWLCIELCDGGDRVLETGDEAFLELEIDAPVIVVFTKFDRFVTSKEVLIMDNDSGELRDDELLARCKAQADRDFEMICRPPLEKLSRKRVPPYLKASTQKGYEDTLENLIETTLSVVAEEVKIIWGIAQRASTNASIVASIAVGKKKYWRGLASSAQKAGRPLEKCLNVIHKDIIAVWNFNDPNEFLNGNEFQRQLTGLLKCLADPDAPDPNLNLKKTAAGMATIVGIVSATAPPVAPIVTGILAGLVVAKWVYDVYQQTRGIIRCLMGYITGLTIVLLRLAALDLEERWAKRSGPITAELAMRALEGYDKSTSKEMVHKDIIKFVDGAKLLDRVDKDIILEEVTRLIQAYGIHSEKMRMNSTMRDMATA